MFLNFPNAPLTQSNRIDNLPENDLNLIRDVAIQNGGKEFQVQLRDLLYRVSNRPVEGYGNIFEVEVCAYDDLDKFAERSAEWIGNATRIAKQLNGGLDSATLTKQGLMAKIDLCSFSVNADEFPCSEQHLSCPVMLSVPEKGVFVKNSRQSDICYLFDEAALIQFMVDEGIHPLSRVPLSADMIVGKHQCHFDATKGHFTTS